MKLAAFIAELQEIEKILPTDFEILFSDLHGSFGVPDYTLNVRPLTRLRKGFRWPSRYARKSALLLVPKKGSKP